MQEIDAVACAVLIVEDETILAKNIKSYLDRHGFETHSASSGPQALSELARQRPDAVLLDYNLPGMNGVTLIGEIRCRYPEIRIVMLTGYASPELANVATKAGARAFLTKPVALSKIARALESSD